MKSRANDFLLNIFVFISLLFLALFHGDGFKGYLINTWNMLYVFCSLIVAWMVYKKTHWSMGLAIAYLLCNAFWAQVYAITPKNGVYISYVTSQALFTITLLLAIGYTFSRYKVAVLYALTFILIGDSLAIIGERLYTEWWWAKYITEVMNEDQRLNTTQVGKIFFGAPSTNAMIIAIIYPLMFLYFPFKRWFLILFLLPIVAMVCTSTEGWLPIVAAEATAWAWLKVKLSRPMRIAIVGAVLIAVEYYIVNTDKALIERLGSGRLEIWQGLMLWWTANANHWLGTGISTSYYYLPYLKPALNLGMASHSWFFLHADWLQLLFECGWIGVILVANACYFMLKNTASKPWLFCLLAGLMASSFFGYPFRYHFSALICVIFFFLPYDRRGN